MSINFKFICMMKIIKKNVQKKLSVKIFAIDNEY